MASRDIRADAEALRRLPREHKNISYIRNIICSLGTAFQTIRDIRADAVALLGSR